MAEEILLDLHIPVFVLTVELQVVPLGHIIDSEDAVVAVHGQVLHGGHRGGDHLFEVVHFVDMLGLSPETIGAVNEDKVLIAVIDHLAHIVEVDVLEEGEDGEHVEGVAWADDGSLHAVLYIHVFVVVTISGTLEVPARTILELLRDLPEVPVFRHPRKRWCTISSIDFETVECRPCSKCYSSQSLP